MANEPERVELIKDGRVEIALTESHPDSLNNEPGYSGSPDTARIFGSVGSIVTFFDDQQFRTGQNAVMIEKKVPEAIDVVIKDNFVKTDEEKGDGVFTGEEPQYKWALFKSVEKDWFRENIPLDWDQVQAKAESDSNNNEYMQIGQTVVRWFGFGKSTSNNYRTDNVSSVKFGK